MGWTEEERKAAIEVQRLAERLVDREVYLCVSGWVDWAIKICSGVDCLDALKSGCPINPEDIPAFRECETCEGVGEVESFEGAGDWEDCSECEGGEQAIEIFEWYYVSGWLGRKLEERGCVVLERHYYGRETTGQSMSLDGVIQEIAREMFS
jgi:hypothetical protein